MTRAGLVRNSVFVNTPPRVPISSRSLARKVENLLSGGNGTVFGYDRYYKGAGSDFGDFPTNTTSITWGYNVDGGQWFEAATTTAGVNRVWAQVGFNAVVGESYLLSFTVDSKTGSHGNGNVSIANGTFTGGTTLLTNPAPGRYVLGGLCTSGGAIQVRLGIGVNNTNAADATIRYSNIMLERVPSGRVYPSEYVRPGDQHVFNFSMSAGVTSGLVEAPVVGSAYPIPSNSSVLFLGDSFANDPGDYPTWLRYFLQSVPIAANGMGNPGAAIAAITAQVATGVSRRSTSPLASPYTLCIAHGGVNDVNGNRTLEQMKADRLAQINAIQSYGMYPLLLTTSPLNSANAGQQSVMDGYNAWIKTLGYPTYDLFTDASDGSADFKASWGSPDGVHPDTAFGKGYYVMGNRLANLIQLVTDARVTVVKNA